jgi:hypothetical protein
MGRDGVSLRLFTSGDAEAVAAACRDSTIPRFTFMAEGLSVADAERWIRKSDEGWRTDTGRFAIVDDSSGQFLGQVGLAVS